MRKLYLVGLTLSAFFMLAGAGTAVNAGVET